MAKEINLLPKKNVGFLEQEKTIMAARVISILAVILVGISSVAVFIISKNFSLQAIDNQQQAIQTKLDLLKNKTTDQLILMDRMSKIEKVIKKKSSLEDKIIALQKLVPSEVTVESLAVTPDTFSIVVSSSSLSSLQSFLDSATQKVTGKILLKKLTINNVQLNQQTGKYGVSIQGTFL